MTEQEMARQILNERKELAREILADRKAEQHVNNQVASDVEPDQEDSSGFLDVIKKINYYSNEIKYNFLSGTAQSVTTGVGYLSDVSGLDTLKEMSEDTEQYLEKQFTTTSTLGELSNTGGRIATGMFLTRGMGYTVPSNTVRGGGIDFLAFSGDEGNIADVLNDYGLQNDYIEYLKTDSDDTETEKRFKNALQGAGIGLAVDSIFSAVKYGKHLLKGSEDTFKGSDEELVQHTESLIKQDVDRVSKALEEQAVKSDVVEEAVEVDISKRQAMSTGVGDVKNTADLNYGEHLYEQANAFIKQVDTDETLDLTQPINAPRTAGESAEVLSKATQDIDTPATRTFEEISKEVDTELKAKIGEESFDLMEDMLQSAKSFEGLDVKINQQRVVVGTLAKALDDSIKLAQKDTTTANVMVVMQNLKNLKDTSTILKRSGSKLAQALSSMRIDTMRLDMLNTLKVIDGIDPDHAMLRLKQAVGKDDAVELQKFMDDLSDTTKTLKEKVENMSDTLYQKITNSLSEVVVAGMLSAPSTLAVNVIGNSLVKHQRLLQDTAQFVWGQATRSADRISLREYKHLLHANVGRNFEDIRLIGKNIKQWGASKFSDEVYDNAVLVKFKQDQNFQHKYFDSKYWFGKDGTQSGAFNTTIDVYGKLARSPYNVIGYVDDYYKRGAFRAELIRLGGRLATKRGIEGTKFDEFINKFIQANTELRLIQNQNKLPTEEWIKTNQEFVGTGSGLTKYADLATENANYMTFQKDLGEGLVGKSVNLLNSDGVLRMLVPFKLTPINILKHSASTATDSIRLTLNGDIAKGGIKGDIARAKITTSVAIMMALGSMATSGHLTGTHSREERDEMQSAGIPSLSAKVGDKWIEYKQVEPYATIAGVMVDLNKLYTGLAYRIEDARLSGEMQQEFQQIFADLGLVLVNNITDKTYAKSLFEALELFNGETNLVDYGGKLLSSTVPLSSLTNYVGRVTNEGFKKEAVGFMEKIRSKYRWTLDRDALDLYGRPIKETEYVGGFTLKQYDANDPANEGAREIARLGVEVGKMSKNVMMNIAGQTLKVELTPEQHWKLRRSLDKDFGLSRRLNNQVNSIGYQLANNFSKKAQLEAIIANIKKSAILKIKTEVDIKDKLVKKSKALVTEVRRPEGERTTWNDIVIGKVGE